MDNGFCACGCGELAPIARRSDKRHGHVKGQPVRFAFGHGRRLSGVDWVEEDRGYITPCWVWQRGLTYGYGSRGGKDGKTARVHIQNYEAKYGPVPDGLVLDHLCRVRACVNPDHLEPVTMAVNNQRGANAKLTPDAVEAIRGLITGGWVMADIARAYGVSAPLLSRIKYGLSWR